MLAIDQHEHIESQLFCTNDMQGRSPYLGLHSAKDVRREHPKVSNETSGRAVAGTKYCNCQKQSNE
eukprot:scaffold351885_cov40-Prasinocladus_malaysianus.AAC.2